jgi:hypothetical protein
METMMSAKKLFICAFLVWCFSRILPTDCAAQEGACLSGAVRNAAGALISGASVTALNLSTQASYNTSTNASGVYQFTTSQVPAGNYYEISIYVLGSGTIYRQSIPVASCPTTANFNLSANTVAITVSASGRTYSVDGISFTDSRTFYFVPGSRTTIGTPEVQTLIGGTRWTFTSWSDGGASTHLVTVPSVATTSQFRGLVFPSQQHRAIDGKTECRICVFQLERIPDGDRKPTIDCDDKPGSCHGALHRGLYGDHQSLGAQFQR